jgi:hypothetical protein
MYFSVSHNRPSFLLYIICVVSKSSAGDIGSPLLSELTKHGDATVQALPLCVPCCNVNMWPENRNNLNSQNQEYYFSTRQRVQDVHISGYVVILIPLTYIYGG